MNMEALEKAQQESENVDSEDTMYDDVAPSTQHANQIDKFAYLNEGTELDSNSQEVHHKDYDIGIEFGLASAGCDAREELLRNRMSDNEFCSLVSSFNLQQKEFFYHVLKTVKTSNEQFFYFLSGGAGVGKTCLTTGLYQALVRHYNSVEGMNPDIISVLLTAPTGKAAYLIKGQTLHSALKIPANQGFKYKPLQTSNLNTM